MLHAQKESADDLLLTQWSNILGSSLPPRRIQETREVAALAEKGDPKVWEQLRGKAVTMWAPTSGNALTRLLSALLRLAGSQDSPTSVRFVVPFQLQPGSASPETIMDLWWSPLLGEKWASVVKGVVFAPHPFELILPGHHCPQHVRLGLALFKLSFIGPWFIPRTLEFKLALMQLEAVTVTTVDMLANDLPRFCAIIQDPMLGQIVCPPRSGVGRTKDLPRITIDLIFPLLYQLLIFFSCGIFVAPSSPRRRSSAPP